MSRFPLIPRFMLEYFKSHTHAAGDIDSGTLPVERGGTGIVSYAQGDLVYASVADTLARRAIGTSGQVLTATGTPKSPTWSYRSLRVPFHHNATGTGQWTNMPAAETFLFGLTSNATEVDTSLFTQCRLLVWVDVAGASGAKLILKYYTSGFYSAVGSFADAGTSEVSCAVDSGRGHVSSSWTALASGAIAADALFTVTGSGGDGATDPRFHNVCMEFR